MPDENNLSIAGWRAYLKRLDSSDLSHRLKEGLRWRAQRLWGPLPYDFEDVLAFWRDQLLATPRQFVVYGAGTLAGEVFKRLNPSLYRDQLVGFLDTRYGKADFSHLPAPVFPIHAIGGLTFDQLIVFHPDAEDEMARVALENGVAEECIKRCFSSAFWREQAKRKLERLLAYMQSNENTAPTSQDGEPH